MAHILDVWSKKVKFHVFFLLLGESQTLLAAAAERERAATEELLANKIQMSSSESQNSLLRQENTRLQAQLEVERNKLKKMENENSRWVHCLLTAFLFNVVKWSVDMTVQGVGTMLQKKMLRILCFILKIKRCYIDNIL